MSAVYTANFFTDKLHFAHFIGETALRDRGRRSRIGTVVDLNSYFPMYDGERAELASIRQ